MATLVYWPAETRTERQERSQEVVRLAALPEGFGPMARTSSAKFASPFFPD